MVGPSPQFPNVPQTAGVPPVFRNSTNSEAIDTKVLRLTKDSDKIAAAIPPWGLYTFPGGDLALEGDSVVAMEPGREARISDYQTEDGGFQTYNKIMTAGEIRVTVTKGGSIDARSAFLGTLNKLVESTDLFNVIAPDFAGVNYNLTRYDFRRTAESGVSLLTVELRCQEVRETAKIAYIDPKKPSGTDPVNAGPVQPLPPTAAQTPAPAPTPSKNIAVNKIAPALPGASFADKAKVVSGVIQAGGTIYDLATKGVNFQSIPMLVTAAQTLTTSLAGQNVRLDISQKAFGLFADVYVNGALVIGGVLAEADNPIVRSSYLGFLGDLYFFDTQGGGGSPTFEELGSRYALLFAGA